MLVWSMRCGSVLLLGLIGIEGTRVFRKNCSVATIRFAKTKISTSVQLFLRLRTPFRPLRGGNGPLCVRSAVFPASIHVLTPAAIRNRKKVAILGVFLFFGTRIGLMLVPWAGWPGRGAFVDDFGQRCGRGRLGSAVRGCPGGATWAAGCLGQRDAVNGVGLA